MMFIIILAVAGVWSSRRRPWKGGKGRMAVVEAFTVVPLPFVLAEVTTGIVSVLTGELSIPPTVGIGAAVDLAILLAGIVVSSLRALTLSPSKEEEARPS